MGSSAPIRDAAIRLLAVPTTSSRELVGAARSYGLSESEATALLVEPEPDSMEMAGAFAKLHERVKETL